MSVRDLSSCHLCSRGQCKRVVAEQRKETVTLFKCRPLPVLPARSHLSKCEKDQPLLSAFYSKNVPQILCISWKCPSVECQCSMLTYCYIFFKMKSLVCFSVSENPPGKSLCLHILFYICDIEYILP